MRTLKPEVRSTQFATRRTTEWALASLIACALAQVTASFAADYAIDWWTVAGGGGTSTGGVFTATSSIGQPAAGQASGGQFTVAGGFWGIIGAVQTPGAPLLTITHTTTNSVVVSWPSTAAGFTLQTNTTIAIPTWGSMAATPSDDGTNKFVIVSPPGGNRFFRLSK